MAGIIVNHSDEDLAEADILHETLRARGWEVLTNRHLPVGRRLDEYLEAALPGVECVVTIWSRSSVAVPRIRDLADEALQRGISVPVRLHGVRLPLGQRSVRTIDIPEGEDLSHARALEELVRCVEDVLAGIPPADTGQEPSDSHPSLSVRVARRVIEALKQEMEVPLREQQGLADVFYIGTWQIDVGSNTISGHGTIKRIGPRAMEVLVYLASRSPNTVSVEEILDSVWRDRVVVDSAVHRCIRELRIALEDDVREPRYIETFSRRGYRIVADVSLSR